MDANSNADQGVVSADADEESYSACNPSSSTSQQSNSSNESLGDSEGFDVSDDSTFSSSSGTSNSSSERKKKVSRSDDKKKKPFKEKRRDERHISSLEVPKLTGVDDYELWRTMTELKLKVQKLWPIVTEKVLFKDFWNSSRKCRWETQWLKAQESIARSLGPRLAGRYRRPLVNCNAAVLFQEIEKKYNAGSAEKNDLMIKSEMVSRKLVQGERVDTYIDAVMRLQEDLVTLGFPLEDPELARLLLTMLWKCSPTSAIN
ncbi:hypothetical protein GN244_ATG12997 [Phytophthora infestans]|nr:hypothetical protein GN244_ATG12997 [Phytophthora infestans]